MKIPDICKTIREKDKLAAILLTVLFVLQIIPLLYLGRFNHPTSDDFKYGAYSHTAWQETGSLTAVIEAAVKGVAEDYRTWQGSYSALFLMRLEPTVFGERYYGLVPWIMLGILTAGTLYFLRTLCKVVLKSDTPHYISMSMLVLSLCVQFSPVASEQFFWYNSSVYYNAFHAILLFYLGWLIRFGCEGKKRYIVYMVLGGPLLGGGNYVTALFLFICHVTALGILWHWKKRKEFRTVLFLWIEFVVCFVISAAAPGNAVRGSEIAGYGAVSSIIRSLLQGVRYYMAWIDKWWLLAALFLLPMMLELIRKTSFQFRFPGFVLLYLYGAFSAMSCPTFYALGSTGPGRIINIIYDSFLLVSYVQMFYLLGYICRRWEEAVSDEAGQKERVNGLLVSLYNSALIVLLGILLLSGTILDMTTVTACKVWVTGKGKQYDQEYKERLAVLEDESVTDVVFEPYTVEPDLVFIADGTDDPEFVNNREWADFYGKNSLVILPGEE
ncbi:MAG: hypothetical protein NC123_20355 [Butyrivibrio sp.]|nr:hypothetical protein [Butyrivibrio sp.]